jgi:serine/threonine-protein kinase
LIAKAPTAIIRFVNDDADDNQTGTAERLGRYELVRRLGKGGMGEVFLAKAQGARGFEKHVAIKRILPQYSANKQVVNMLVDEARISVLLNHPNVVQVHELDEADGSHFIVMEYVDGHAVSRLIRRLKKRGERMDPLIAAYILIHVLEGLHAAHTQKDGSGELAGIIHRDVSPQNVLLSMTGQIKVIDFGIARARDRLEATQGSQVKGKLRYMAPEQIKPSLAGSAGIDHRVDVFAAGIVLFEMLAMRQRFPQTGDIEIIDAILESDVPDVYSEGLVDEAMMEILETALQRDRKRRYKDAAAFAAALRGYLYARDPAFNGERVARLMRRVFTDEVDDAPEAIVRAPARAQEEADEPAPMPSVKRGKVTVKPARAQPTPLHEPSDRDEETRTQFRPPVVVEPVATRAAPAVRRASMPRPPPALLIGAIVGAVLLVGAGFLVRWLMRPQQLNVDGTPTVAAVAPPPPITNEPPPPPPPPSAGDALQFVVEVVPATAHISRAWQPDPKYVSPARLDVKQGETLELQFDAEGYEPLRKTFVVDGANPRVQVQMVPIPMPLLVRPVPRDAEVIVNGKPWRQGMTVNPGDNLTITVTHPFYFETTRTMVVKPAQQLLVDVTLDEKTSAPKEAVVDNPAITTGTVVVRSNPKGAEVFVDGANMGTTPVDLKVSPGQHRVTVRGTGAETTFAVDVAVGERLERTVNLE